MINDSDLQQWHWVREKIRAELGGTQFKSWIEPVVLSSVAQGIVKLCVQTNAGRDWIRRHFGDKLRAYWCELNPEIRQVDILCSGSGGALSAPVDSNPKCQCEARYPCPRPFPAPVNLPRQTGML